VKKRYVIIGLLAASLTSFGQQQSSYKKKHLKTTDVQMLFSYYTQDNDHSAVTGGVGTEDLQVYAAQLSIDTQKDSLYSFHIDSGIDVITSASTDNIDFVVSSASKNDARTHLNLGYNRMINRKNVSIGINTGFSIESDYFSRALGLSWSKSDAVRQREVSVSLQSFFDDLRWGRLDNGKPQKLIYPSELRTKEWFDTYKRNSFNLEMEVYQIINRRIALGIYPGISYQRGLLATPFHRVYFFDDEELVRVENLPDSRLKVPIGFQLNSFVGSRTILRSYYRFYWDDFGIVAHTLSLEAPVKISRVFTVSPSIRFYTQTGADFFRPYKKHYSSQKFFTSDYDLGKIHSYTPGFSISYLPVNSKSFREIESRYSRYKRSDGLIAHAISIYFGFKREKQK
jgi:hypothetical protein